MMTMGLSTAQKVVILLIAGPIINNMANGKNSTTSALGWIGYIVLLIILCT